MSTRCIVKVHDPEAENQTDCPVMLYHHRDGNPDFMLPKIKRFLEASHAYLVEKWYDTAWNSLMVAALFIIMSVEDHSDPLMPYSTDRPDYSSIPFEPCRANNGLPEFLPCAVLPEGLEFIYDVWLSPVPGCFRIEHQAVDPKQ